MITSDTLKDVSPGHPGTPSFLSDDEWLHIYDALVRGVTVESIYPLVSDKYKNPKSFRRAIENRYGRLADIRGPWKSDVA